MYPTEKFRRSKLRPLNVMPWFENKSYKYFKMLFNLFESYYKNTSTST